LITNKLYTIQEHLDIVPNRYLLATIIMKRTRELVNGAPTKSGLGEEFFQQHPGDTPKQSLCKTALEEIRIGKLNWTAPVEKRPELPPIDAIVFSPTTI